MFSTRATSKVFPSDDYFFSSYISLRLKTFNFKKELESDLKHIGTYQKSLSGGSLVSINLSKNSSTNDLLKIVKLSKDNDVGFITFDLRS